MRRLFRWIAVTVGAGAAAVIALLAVAWAAHDVPLTLPKPSGPYAVSRVSEVWTDDTRPDALTETQVAKTELVIWMWYPSSARGSATTVDYLPTDLAKALRVQQGPILRNFIVRNPARITPHAVAARPLAEDRQTYPIIILRAGLGALTLNYATLAEALASRGYVVVGFDAPYRTGVVVFPNGRVITRPAHLNPESLTGATAQALLERLQGAWVRDLRFVTDRLHHLNDTPGPFRGRLQLQQLAVVGHSLGGASALEFCRQDDRCRTVVNMDGALYGPIINEGVRQPVLLLMSDHGSELNPADQQIAADLRSAFARSTSEPRQAFVLAGAGHFSFSDMMLLRSPLLRSLAGSTLDPDRALMLISEIVGRFLDVQFNGLPVARLRSIPSEYPELRESFGGL
jgi:dienelactone hydrolase